MSPSVLRVVAGTVCAAALLGLPAAGAAAAAKRPPRLYSAVVPRGRDFARIFQVRPRTVTVRCADGGMLELTWRRWTRNSASGSGWTRPCDGAPQPIGVFVSRPVDGYFTRMTVRYDGGAPNRLGLGHVGGRLAWMGVSGLIAPWPR